VTTNYNQPLGSIDKETHRYLALTKAYPNRHFCCDSCGSEYQSATFYSLAYHESQLPYARVYCEKCLKTTSAGQKRCQREINESMKKKKINKTKQVKLIAKKNQKLKNPNLPTKTKKQNTLAYYNCLVEKIANPNKAKAKITHLAHHCKCNKSQVAQVQAKHKQQLIQKLAQNYKAFGESLGHYLHADIVGCVKELPKK
jgi:hypothetical protein